jgi:hypothetical protein
MAELQFGDPLGSYERGASLGRADNFRRLAGLAATAPTDQQQPLLNQAIQADPQQGLALKGSLEQFQDAHEKKVANAANYVLQAYKTGNPAQLEGAYQAVRPFLNQIGATMGQTAPDHFDPSMLLP